MKHTALIIFILLVSAAGLFKPSQAQSSLQRTHTESFTYDDDSLDSDQLVNIGAAFKQMQAFFSGGVLTGGVTYSYDRDVLKNGLLREDGYVLTQHGFGNGANAAATLLNALVHQALFWDSDGVQKPVLQQVSGTLLKNDVALGAYAVLISVAVPGAQDSDYTWQVNPAYTGTPPQIAVEYNADTVTAKLTMTYSDKINPPAAPQTVLNKSLVATLQQMIGNNRIGVTVYPVDQPDHIVEFNQDDQVPSASAWKGAGLIYFFERISPDIWRSVPVKYWDSINPLRVPPEYRDAWNKYHEILREVYVMSVFSGNHEAANVLLYVFQHTDQPKDSNPIKAFNDWCREAAGISWSSGLYSWHFGNLMAPNVVDPRYLNRVIHLNDGEDLTYTTTFSSHDLALAFYHLATVGRKMGYYDTLVSLLSIRTGIVSKIEGQVANDPEIQTATKDGYFSPESALSLGHDVNNDAGLLIFPDGTTYVAAFTAMDAVPLESDVVGVMVRAIVADKAASATATTTTATTTP